MNTKFYIIECISQTFIDRVGEMTYKQPLSTKKATTTTTFYKTLEDYITGNSGLMPHIHRQLTFPVTLPQKPSIYSLLLEHEVSITFKTFFSVPKFSSTFQVKTCSKPYEGTMFP